MNRTVPGNPRTRLLLAALLPALATALTLAPVLFSPPEQVPLMLGLLIVSSAPAVALVVNWRWPAATNKDRAAWAALPQVAVVPLMVRLDVWLDVRSGYLLRHSGEEAMAYGIGTVFGVLAGIVLVVLVGFAGRLGASLGGG
ncbi:MAG: hypothetical protein AVDCRST_MAG48-1157 [uncultured Friedmanniella sp.]|uniref:Uncharacterized protein n=1 Tax=uncultured Friedmanniella sp. TaxID=335381 RepID=A0A6J4KA26_9ACTN|nr:MAG: hypothetical protein AVDCRST_MAG48-1157 [uncultured Friedmanniella sp.]